ncbi:hypothetical protein K4F52_007291 [Lecanicillium sp. MT-2017a]|nr:hypothetical protein K4F52_007291 [Lecanicillium sp. MT-2017a]
MGVTGLPSPAKITTRSDGMNKVGYIDVSVATVWTDSSKPRDVDAPALTNPADIKTWLSSMTVDQYLDLTDSSRTQTQAVYGTLVHILDYKDGWYKIAVTGEPSPKNDLGYPGWVPATQVSLDQGYGSLQSDKSFALVDKEATVPLYRDFFLRETFMDISYDTRLPVTLNLGLAVQVVAPSGGSAYIRGADVTIYGSEKDIPYPSKEDLMTTAKLLLGKPYLWGGTSGFALDCSGFTHTVYHAHGITIGRDTGPQASSTDAIPVKKEDLQTGDLLFYATNVSDADTIHHVAMYAGNGEMAEAYGAGVPVRITPARFGSEYCGARRYLK